jgi:hypothetical protein
VSRRRRWFPTRVVVLVVVVPALIVYRESIDSWVWTLLVGIGVVLVVYYWLGFLRRSRR